VSALLNQLELLAGQTSTLKKPFDKSINLRAFDEGDIGVSQLNELLLTAGFDWVTEDFFALLCNGKPTPYEDGTNIRGLKDLKQKVESFRELAILKYGNFKYAFKLWSPMCLEDLKDEFDDILPRRPLYFSTRTSPLEEIGTIPIKDRYLLGYVSSVRDPALRSRKLKAKRIGESNLRKYLTFDHMDVYVATSMRRYRDYLSVGKFVDEVFGSKDIKEFKIRYFDPTVVYSSDRFCKSLLESLMLKRAKCAIYCAQETDTLGKDSELATTLAQGKPVLAYVPKIDNIEEYKRKLVRDSKEENRDDPVLSLRGYFISNFPTEALRDPALISSVDLDKLALRLAKLFQHRFEERAKILQTVHPLALQVNLNTGVANGVLLVRNAKQCIKVLKKVLLRNLDFYLEKIDPSYQEYACGDYTETYVLREKITSSPYRIVIGDELLTNSFWNYYLEQQ